MLDLKVGFRECFEADGGKICNRAKVDSASWYGLQDVSQATAIQVPEPTSSRRGSPTLPSLKEELANQATGDS